MNTVWCMQRNSMTKREEEVLDMVVQGIPNKSIASKLDVSQRTIESRRQWWVKHRALCGKDSLR